MGYMAFLKDSSNEAIGSGVSLTASSSASGYNVANLLQGKPWRATGITSEYVEIDCGSAKSVRMGFIRGHNLSATATITVKGGPAANPSTVTETFTWREFDAYKLFTTTHSYRFWRFTFADTSNLAGFIQIRGLGLGVHTQPDFHFAWGWRKVPEQISRRLESEYLVPNVEHIAERVRLELPFELTDAESTTLLDLHRAVKKDKTPVFLVPITSKYEGYYGRFGDIEMIGNPARVIVLPFIEDGRGNVMSL